MINWFGKCTLLDINTNGGKSRNGRDQWSDSDISYRLNCGSVTGMMWWGQAHPHSEARAGEFFSLSEDVYF